MPANNLSHQQRMKNPPPIDIKSIELFSSKFFQLLFCAFILVVGNINPIKTSKKRRFLCFFFKSMVLIKLCYNYLI